MNGNLPIEALLDACLQRHKAGEKIDQILADYPQRQDELRPLLLLAAAAERSRRPVISAARRQQGLDEMLAHVDARESKKRAQWWHGFLGNRSFAPSWQAYVTVVSLAALILLVGSALFVLNGQSEQPTVAAAIAGAEVEQSATPTLIGSLTSTPLATEGAETETPAGTPIPPTATSTDFTPTATATSALPSPTTTPFLTPIPPMTSSPTSVPPTPTPYAFNPEGMWTVPEYPLVEEFITVNIVGTATGCLPQLEEVTIPPTRIIEIQLVIPDACDGTTGDWSLQTILDPLEAGSHLIRVFLSESGESSIYAERLLYVQHSFQEHTPTPEGQVPTTTATSPAPAPSPTLFPGTLTPTATASSMTTTPPPPSPTP